MLNKYLNDFKIFLLIVIPYLLVVIAIVGIFFVIKEVKFDNKLEIRYTTSRKPQIIEIKELEAKTLPDLAMYSKFARSSKEENRNEVIKALKVCEIGTIKIKGIDLIKDLQIIRYNLENIPQYDSDNNPLNIPFIYKVRPFEGVDYKECYSNLLFNEKGVFIEIGDGK